MDSTLAAPATSTQSIDAGAGAGSTNPVDATPPPISGFAPALSNALRALRSQASATASNGTDATTQVVAPLAVGSDDVETILDASEVDQDQGTVQQGPVSRVGAALEALLTPAPIVEPIGQRPVVASVADSPNAELAISLQAATATVASGDVQPPTVPGTFVPTESVVAPASASGTHADGSPLAVADLSGSPDAPSGLAATTRQQPNVEQPAAASTNPAARGDGSVDRPTDASSQPGGVTTETTLQAKPSTTSEQSPTENESDKAIATAPASTTGAAAMADDGPNPPTTAVAGATPAGPTAQSAPTTDVVAEAVPDSAPAEQLTQSAPATDIAADTADVLPGASRLVGDPIANGAAVADGAVATTRQVDAAPAAEAVAPPPTSDGPDEALWGQVQRALNRVRAEAHGQELTVRLNPAELGELILKVRTQGDEVTVRLVATSATSHQALLGDRQRLATELHNAGFNDGFVDISHQDLNSGDSSHESDPSSQERSDHTHLIAPNVGRRPTAAVQFGQRGGSSINLSL